MPQKTILITGCGLTGIGASLAKEFQLRGHRVIATGLNQQLLSSLADLSMETLVMDVTSDESIEAAVAQVRKLTTTGAADNGGAAANSVDKREKETGHIDILINNAGVLQILPFSDTAPSTIRRVFDINVVGAMTVTRAFIPLLVNGAARQRHLSSQSQSKPSETIIANICSINSDLRPPFLALYNSSKAALDVFGATIRPELAPLGVRVVTIKSGAIQTDLFANTPSSEPPETSYYHEALAEFLGKRMMFQGTRFMDSEVYAKSVVGQLLRDRPSWGWSWLWPGPKKVIWEGNLIVLAWAVRLFGFDTLWDWALTYGNQIDRVRPPPYSG